MKSLTVLRQIFYTRNLELQLDDAKPLEAMIIDGSTSSDDSYVPDGVNGTQAMLQIQKYNLVALPQYIIFYTILGLLAITALVKIEYLLKISMIIGLVTAQSLLVYLALNQSFDLYRMIIELNVQLVYVIILIIVASALIIINRQV